MEISWLLSFNVLIREWAKIPRSEASTLFGITKYRKPVLFGEVSVRTRDLMREICKSLAILNY